MTPDEAFLADILAHPDDDAPRLIYADWLEEHGQSERAELIRRQLELLQLEALEHDCGEKGEGETTCPACAAYAHQSWLRRQMLHRIDNGAYGFLVPEWTETKEGDWTWSGTESRIEIHCGPAGPEYPLMLVWRRGFMEEVSCPLALWLEHGPQIARQHPLRPDGVRITDRRPMRLGGDGPDSVGDILPMRWHWIDVRDMRGPSPPGFAIDFGLPQGLLDLMGDYRSGFPSKEAAHAALSRAALTWAWQQKPGRVI